MLETAIQAASKQPERAEAAKAAQALLDAVVAEVCADDTPPCWWAREGIDRTTANRARAKTLEALDKLEAGN
jgi:hypothetical protein